MSCILSVCFFSSSYYFHRGRYCWVDVCVNCCALYGKKAKAGVSQAASGRTLSVMIIGVAIEFSRFVHFVHSRAPSTLIKTVDFFFGLCIFTVELFSEVFFYFFWNVMSTHTREISVRYFSRVVFCFHGSKTKGNPNNFDLCFQSVWFYLFAERRHTEGNEQ